MLMSVMKNHHHQSSSYFPTTLSSIAIIFLLTSGWIGIGSAEDGGGLDMSALANLASTIGSNPQIMNMVSGLFNQNSAKSSAANNGPNVFDSVGPAAAGVQSSALDQDQLNNQLGGSSSAADTATAAAASVLGQVQRSPIQQQVAKQEASSAPSKQTGGSSLSSLMSLLPSVLPALSGVGSKGSLASVVAAASSQSSPVAPPAQSSPMPSIASSPIVQTQIAAVAAPQIAAAGGNPAQAVINQVLTAYASGQIPPEMIQLGLSGRVPPLIMELALSGQVPPQIIQMVITGQIPMSTINAFLSTVQPAAGSRSAVAADALTGVSTSDLNSNSINRAGSGGIISTTRALVEALFKPSVNGGRKIIVPTLLGPLPIQIPSLPSVSQFGKMVGSSIHNMASMVPF